SHYSLKATARNAQGESEPVDIEISLFTAPQIEPLDLAIPEGSTAGTQVGRMRVYANGTSIDSIALSGTGSEDFRIGKNGDIFVANTLNASRQNYYELTATINDAVTALLQITLQDRIIDTLTNVGEAAELTTSLDGAILYVANHGYNGAVMIDVSDPSELTYWGKISGRYPQYLDISTDGSRLAIGHSSNISLFDITDAAYPVHLSDYALQGHSSLSAKFMHRHNSLLAGGKENVQILTEEINGSLAYTGDLDAGNAKDVVISPDDKTAYIADYSEGIVAYDISDPNYTARIGGTWPDYRWTNCRLAISNDGRRLFIAGGGQMDIWDITNPDKAKKIGALSGLPHQINAVTLSENGLKAFISANDLYISDISDPTAPVLIGQISIPGGAKETVLLEGEARAAVAAGKSGVHLISTEGFDIPEKAPGLLGIETMIEADAEPGTAVESVEIVYAGSGGISSFMLSGDGAEDFTIDHSGNISTAKPLDAERKSYNLKVIATNSAGSREEDAVIHLHGVPEIADLTVL
ncbi:MAG: hypothetical protein B5M52_05015, partial [Helicobacteraceae bacterium 4484_230]